MVRHTVLQFPWSDTYANLMRTSPVRVYGSHRVRPKIRHPVWGRNTADITFFFFFFWWPWENALCIPPPSGEGRGLCGPPGGNAAGLPAKTPGMAFRASGGAGGDPGLANAIHRRPRLCISSALRARRSCSADRRATIPGEGEALPLLPNRGQMGPCHPPTFLADPPDRLGPPPSTTESGGNHTGRRLLAPPVRSGGDSRSPPYLLAPPYHRAGGSFSSLPRPTPNTWRREEGEKEN